VRGASRISIGPGLGEIALESSYEVEALRATLTKARATRRRKRFIWLTVLVLAMAVLFCFRKLILSGHWWRFH